MENPFELILERLQSIEIAIEKLNAPTKNEDEFLLTRLETAKIFKNKFNFFVEAYKKW